MAGRLVAQAGRPVVGRGSNCGASDRPRGLVARREELQLRDTLPGLRFTNNGGPHIRRESVATVLKSSEDGCHGC